MDYKTFKDNIRRSGLGIKEFAGYIGMNHRSISNYSKLGVVPNHLAMIAVMLMELRRCDVGIEEVIAQMNVMRRHERNGLNEGNGNTNP